MRLYPLVVLATFIQAYWFCCRVKRNMPLYVQYKLNLGFYERNGRKLFMHC